MDTLVCHTARGLGSFASSSVVNLNQNARLRAKRCFVRMTFPPSSLVGRRAACGRRVVRGVLKAEEVERSIEQPKELAALGRFFMPLAASAAVHLQMTLPSLAETVEDLRDVIPPETLEDSEYWFQVVVTSGVVGFLYLIVIPLIIINYLRLRWYKRKALETFFQFMLVFVFFPGILLLAPFINLRRLPRENVEPP